MVVLFLGLLDLAFGNAEVQLRGFEIDKVSKLQMQITSYLFSNSLAKKFSQALLIYVIRYLLNNLYILLYYDLCI